MTKALLQKSFGLFLAPMLRKVCILRAAQTMKYLWHTEKKFRYLGFLMTFICICCSSVSSFSFSSFPQDQNVCGCMVMWIPFNSDNEFSVAMRCVWGVSISKALLERCLSVIVWKFRSFSRYSNISTLQHHL